MASSTPPLSSTVESVFSAFIKQLESDDTVPEAVVARLGKALSQQKLDAESLRKALFPPYETDS